MENYLLFKQLVCLILFFKVIVLWPKFHRYFAPPLFQSSWLTSPQRIGAFNLFLLVNIVLTFFNVLSLLTSLFVALSMRYLYVTDSENRIFSGGAVGHVCYFVTAYIFLFEAAFFIDGSQQLVTFIHQVFAIELAVIMLAATYYKVRWGYVSGHGLEYALVNPNWSKFFFVFRKMSPSSWFFSANNYASCIAEFLVGVLFIFPATRLIAASLLLLIFAYIFVLLRVSVLSTIMMSISILYFPPLQFHFPVLDFTMPALNIPHALILGLEVCLVAYIVVLVCTMIYLELAKEKWFYIPQPLATFMETFAKYRPVFIWEVFCSKLTSFFVKIEKVPKEGGRALVVYDGFSQKYREVFSKPRRFLRFIHHHEFSSMNCVFLMPIPFDNTEIRAIGERRFKNRLYDYAKTFVPKSDFGKYRIKFTVILIEKTAKNFSYVPDATYFVEL